MSPPTPPNRPICGRLRRWMVAAAVLALTPVLALAGMLALNSVIGSRPGLVARNTAEARHLGVALSSRLYGLPERQAPPLDTYSTFRRESNTMSAVAIPSLGWAGIAATRDDPVSVMARDTRLKHVLSMAVAALVGLLAAVGLMRRVSAEACALEHAAMAVGAGNLSARCGLGGATDVGAAGRAFDEMAASLAELEQSRLRALRVASHELRNPLSAVKGAASLLSMRIDEGKQAYELRPLVDIVVRGADDLTAKMTQIFDALILSNHWRSMDKKPVEIRELTRKALEPFMARSDGNRIVTRGLSAGLPDLVVIGDCEQLETVIVNLVSNGLKYSMGQETVRVIVGPTEGGARISVCDRGIGVPDAERSSIFDGFSRGGNLEGRDPGGLGLGLYVSAMIVRQHGGRIWVESDGQTGTHFHVELPIHPIVV